MRNEFRFPVLDLGNKQYMQPEDLREVKEPYIGGSEYTSVEVEASLVFSDKTWSLEKTLYKRKEPKSERAVANSFSPTLHFFEILNAKQC